MSETEITAARAEMARLRAEAADAYDRYDNATCRDLHAKAWALQDQVEAALAVRGR
jgi:hypothetical protein